MICTIGFSQDLPKKKVISDTTKVEVNVKQEIKKVEQLSTKYDKLMKKSDIKQDTIN